MSFSITNPQDTLKIIELMQSLLEDRDDTGGTEALISTSDSINNPYYKSLEDFQEYFEDHWLSALKQRLKPGPVRFRVFTEDNYVHFIFKVGKLNETI
jgi:hypothetical protein